MFLRKTKILTSVQKLPSLIFSDKIEKTFSYTKITYFLLRCRRNVGGRDQITMTNDHKLFFFLSKKHKQIFIVYSLLSDPRI